MKEFELLRKNFSETGNFGARSSARDALLPRLIPTSGFGINEHIDLGLKYDPSTGIYGAWRASLPSLSLQPAPVKLIAPRTCSWRAGGRMNLVPQHAALRPRSTLQAPRAAASARGVGSAAHPTHRRPTVAPQAWTSTLCWSARGTASRAAAAAAARSATSTS